MPVCPGMAAKEHILFHGFCHGGSPLTAKQEAHIAFRVISLTRVSQLRASTS